MDKKQFSRSNLMEKRKMNHYNPSKTYKYLYDYIIGDLLSQICTNGSKFCVKDKTTPYMIGKKFDEYKERASKNMNGKRLDRHKIASCICGAIIEAKPLQGFNGAVIASNANEILALCVGVNVIKFYMMYDLLHNLDIPTSDKHKIREYLKENFEMEYPSIEDNICDTQEYQKNLHNALYWSHSVCTALGRECFKYDIWAYSKIFYHLELFNKNNFQKVYQSYVQMNTA